MQTTHASRLARVILIVALAGSVATHADTIATFADPVSTGSNSVLFEMANSMLTGGWQNTGLNLITPINSGLYPDATFTMTPLNVDTAGHTSAGVIEFHESAANGGGLILQITFDQAQLFAPFGFGASMLVPNQNVQFSGPIITYPLQEQMFSFSFSNQHTTPTGYTWSAAFTSSAIPEPGSFGLLITALLAFRRR